MIFDPDDPRLTAYALGELEGDDLASVESLLEQNEEARQIVDETRRLGATLSETFRAEPSTGLDPRRRDAIASHLNGTPASAPLSRFPWHPFGLAAAAAVLLGGGTLALYVGRPSSPSAENRELALVSPDTRSPSEITVLEGPILKEPESVDQLEAVAILSDPVAADSELPKHEEDRQERMAGLADEDRSGLESVPNPDERLARKRYDSDSLVLSTGPVSSPAPGQPEGSISAQVSGAADLDAKPRSSSEFFAKKSVGVEFGSAVTREMTAIPGRAEPNSARMFPFALAEAQEESQRGARTERFFGGASGEAHQEVQTGSLSEDSPSGGMGFAPSPAGRTINDFVALGLKDAAPNTSNSPFERDNQNAQTASKPGASPPADVTSRFGARQAGDQASAPSVMGRPSAPMPGQIEPSEEFAELTIRSRSLPAPTAADSAARRAETSPLSGGRTNHLYALAGPPSSEAENAGTLPKLKQLQDKQQVEAIVEQARPAVEPSIREQYNPIVENDFEPVTAANTLSTFSIDVDTASYANVRRFLNQSLLPPPDAVRIEEMVNYFSYHYPSPDGDVPFSVNTEVTRCPWNPDHNIVRIGLKGQEIRFDDRKPTNLVFVVDVSGSMQPANKLALVKAGLRMLAEQLTENDRVSIVVYAGQVGLALPSTTGDQKQTIVQAIDALQAGGSTNGAGGIEMAYDQAVEHFLKDGVNRVILATDGDFNVGTTDAGSLTRIAEEKAKTGVFLSVLGVGEGNLNDQMMEQVADKGNGNYSYLDNLDEARKVLVEQVGGTLVTIAKDVKIQVDFNPAKVGAYRLVGYENRKLANRDFRDDTKDAGEIGSGHTVTALYEIIPPGKEAEKLANAPEASKYVTPAKVDRTAEELLTVRLRYKAPDGQTSKEIQHPVPSEVTDLGRASSDTKFAASVAEFGLLLRGSKYKAQASYDAVLELARANLGDDSSGRRHEFISLIEKARTLPPR